MRSAVASLLLLLGVLLVPVATVGWWAHEVVVPADGFVATLAPLATDPAVVGEVEDRLVAATTQRIAAGIGVPGTGVEPVVRLAVQRAVADPAFARAWRSSTRDVHTQLVGVLSGETSAGAGSEVGVQLAPLSGVVRQQLVSSGVPFADQLPTVQASLPLFGADHLARAQGAFDLVNVWGPVLPFAALLFLALGVLLARHRAAALRRACLGSLVGLGVLAVVVVVVRIVSPAVLPGSLPKPVVHAMLDTLVAGLWRDLLVVAVGALVVLLGSLLVTRSARPR